MGDVEARSSEQLRAEAAQLDLRLTELVSKRTSNEEKIRLLSLAIIRQDSTANGRAVQLKKQRDDLDGELCLVRDARTVIDVEIHDALRREERQRLDAAAAAQDAAADAMEGLGAKVDEAISAFKKALSAFRAAARHAGAYHEGAVEKG